jgi:hypothetical protein
MTELAHLKVWASNAERLSYQASAESSCPAMAPIEVTPDLDVTRQPPAENPSFPHRANSVDGTGGALQKERQRGGVLAEPQSAGL